VAGVLKLYFRELQEPLFPVQLFDELIACSKLDVNGKRLCLYINCKLYGDTWHKVLRLITGAVEYCVCFQLDCSLDRDLILWDAVELGGYDFNLFRGCCVQFVYLAIILLGITSHNMTRIANAP
jgi:hypothetical protein